MLGIGAHRTACALLPVLVAPLLIITTAAKAERIENDVAVFAALDKVTARISRLEVPLGQTVEFGSLKVTPRICYSRPATEQPKTTSFVEVDEKELEGAQKRIFTGWMFAESPGLNAVEHPVFDIWLTGCSHPKGGAQAAAAGSAERPGDAATGADAVPEEQQTTITRRRIRR
ncbi:MAG: DUF2155 domain-containing protein [Hyphomicrobiaceae bacterium]|nr:DUF2155 domain-containing protein [Hyphomicrobiaceae bacterium]